MYGQLEIGCWLYILMLLGYTCIFGFGFGFGFVSVSVSVCFVSFILVYIELQLRHVLVLFECVRGDSVYISYI